MTLRINVQSSQDLLSFIRKSKSSFFDFFYNDGYVFIIDVDPGYVKGLRIPAKCSEDYVAFTVNNSVLKALYTNGDIEIQSTNDIAYVSNVYENSVLCSAQVGLGTSYTYRYDKYINQFDCIDNKINIKIPHCFKDLSNILKTPININNNLIVLLTQSGIAIMNEIEYPGNVSFSYSSALKEIGVIQAIASNSKIWYGTCNSNSFNSIIPSHEFDNAEFKKLFDLKHGKLYSCDIDMKLLLPFLNRNRSALASVNFQKRQIECIVDGVTYNLPMIVSNESLFEKVNFDKINIPSEFLTKILPALKTSKFSFEVFPYFLRIQIDDIMVMFK